MSRSACLLVVLLAVLWFSTSTTPIQAQCATPLIVVGGVVANRIAAFDRNTSEWTAFGSGMDNNVSALAVLASGDLVAGGARSMILDGQQRPRLTNVVADTIR